VKRPTESSKQLLVFASKLYYSTSNIPVSRIGDQLLKSVSFYHMTRARSLLKSISLLYRAGQYPDIHVLLRTLLEVYIRLSWILFGDANAKAERFSNMDTVLRIRAHLKDINSQIKDIDNRLKEIQNWPEEAKRLQKEKGNLRWYIANADSKFRGKYKKAMKIALKYKYKGIMNIGSWHQKKFNKMAEEVGCSYDYDVWYNWFSERGHIGPGAGIDYYIIKPGGLAPRNDGNEMLLTHGIDYFFKTWAVACKGMNAKFTNLTYAYLEFEDIYSHIYSTLPNSFSRLSKLTVN
jgi:hypothetical protein